IPDEIREREMGYIEEGIEQHILSIKQELTGNTDPYLLNSKIEHSRWSLNVDRVDRWVDYLESGQVTKELFFQEILPIIGVKRDNDGLLTLYHATPFHNLISILKDQSIDPVEKHGRDAYGLINYSDVDNKLNENQYKKIYLANNKHATEFADRIRGTIGQPIYIIQVKVNPDNLSIDEDFTKDQRDNAWAYELALSGSCSHYGSIDNFKLVGKLNRDKPSLAEDPYWDVDINEVIKWSQDAVGSEEEKERIKRHWQGQYVTENEEVKSLRSFGIDYDSLQHIEGNTEMVSEY
ncbi:MAG: hypothetical protein ABII80_02825, partial [bacterium]